jgi:hypothetical protein
VARRSRVYPQIRGKIVPADIFDEVMRLVKGIAPPEAKSERQRGPGGSPVTGVV